MKPGGNAFMNFLRNVNIREDKEYLVRCIDQRLPFHNLLLLLLFLLVLMLLMLLLFLVLLLLSRFESLGLRGVVKCLICSSRREYSH
jgi:hypothetical protein